MTGNIFPIFGVRISTAICILHLFVLERETDTETKSTMKTRSVFVECVILSRRLRVACLKVDFVDVCLCDSVFRLFDCQGHLHASHCQAGTHSCVGYEKASIQYTHRDTQIHPDACFGALVDHMITLDG